jgi:hypothetical protein
VDEVDIVDVVAKLEMKRRNSAMVSAVANLTQKTDRAVSAFFDGVRSLNQAAPQVKKISGTAFQGRHRRQVTTYVKELTKLEKAIRQLRAQFSEEAEEEHTASAGSDSKALAATARQAPDSVQTTLERMVRQGKLLASAEFSDQLSWSRQALSKALGSNRVFYVDFKGERYFPAFYADPTYQRVHLEAVTKVLGGQPGGAKLQFFLTRKGSLGGATPLEALAEGKLQKVKDVAAAFADVR